MTGRYYTLKYLNVVSVNSTEQTGIYSLKPSVQ